MSFQIYQDYLTRFKKASLKVSAVADDPIENYCLYGEMKATRDLIYYDEKIKLLLVLFFPKIVACDIYETIFGERNEDDAGEVVLKLSNIIGGNI